MARKYTRKKDRRPVTPPNESEARLNLNALSQVQKLLFQELLKEQGADTPRRQAILTSAVVVDGLIDRNRNIWIDECKAFMAAHGVRT